MKRRRERSVSTVCTVAAVVVIITPCANKPNDGLARGYEMGLLCFTMLMGWGQ